MSTRPLPPPEVLRDDPGPWSVVSSVFAQAGRPGAVVYSMIEGERKRDDFAELVLLSVGHHLLMRRADEECAD